MVKQIVLDLNSLPKKTFIIYPYCIYYVFSTRSIELIISLRDSMTIKSFC